jgi:hypothetical protein
MTMQGASIILKGVWKRWSQDARVGGTKSNRLWGVAPKDIYRCFAFKLSDPNIAFLTYVNRSLSQVQAVPFSSFTSYVRCHWVLLTSSDSSVSAHYLHWAWRWRITLFFKFALFSTICIILYILLTALRSVRSVSWELRISIQIRVLFSGCKIRRENPWLVYLQPTTNHRFSLRILQPEKRTLIQMVHSFWKDGVFHLTRITG